MNRALRAKKISKILNQIYPKTFTPLKHKNIFTLLISVLLSAQCTDVTVNKVTRNIYIKYNKPKDFINLGVKRIEKLIKSIGLFRVKAKNIYTFINGKYHEKVARIYNNLVKVYFDKVEFEKAWDIYLETVEIQKFVYNVDHYSDFKENAF